MAEGFKLSFSVEWEKQASRILNWMVSKLKDMSPIFKEVSETLDEWVKKNFSSEGKEFEVTWDPLSPNTIRQKAKLWYWSKQILERTGALRNAFHAKYGKDFAEVYNDSPYFAYHQSNQARKIIPRRIMFKLTNQYISTIVKIFQKYLTFTDR